MLKVHMKSGVTHILDLYFPDFQELHSDEEMDSIAASDYMNKTSVHVIPKANIESVEVLWEGTLDELEEGAKKYKY